MKNQGGSNDVALVVNHKRRVLCMDDYVTLLDPPSEYNPCKVSNYMLIAGKHQLLPEETYTYALQKDVVEPLRECVVGAQSDIKKIEEQFPNFRGVYTFPRSPFVENPYTSSTSESQPTGGMTTTSTTAAAASISTTSATTVTASTTSVTTASIVPRTTNIAQETKPTSSADSKLAEITEPIARGDLLGDEQINAAMDLIRRQLPGIGGLQNTLLGNYTFGFIPQSEQRPSVQILHNGHHHWVVVASVGGHRLMYIDTLGILPTEDIVYQACQLFPQHVDVKQKCIEFCIMDLQRQQGSN